MGEHHQIRRASLADRTEVLRLWLQLIEYHRALGSDHPPASELLRTLKSEIQRGIQNPACFILVVECERRIDGFLFAESEIPGNAALRSSAVSWIHELFVREEQRRLGLGSALVEYARDSLKDFDTAGIAVRVESANLEGQRFWERHRFVERSRVLELPST
ncbi:MAG: GNAT family N-acetyltransferase [bacterium]|nr:GNAT family N-acetyltransferase [bacterium]